MEIVLSKLVHKKNHAKYCAIVNRCDADLDKFNWQPNVTPTTIYAHRVSLTESGKREAIAMHRAIAERMFGKEAIEGKEIDHINRNGLDNRRRNLRIATHHDQTGNQKLRRDSTSPYKRVRWHKQIKRWVAYKTVGGQRKHVGCFDSARQAAIAADLAAIEIFGEFARTNFPRHILRKYQHVKQRLNARCFTSEIVVVGKSRDESRQPA